MTRLARPASAALANGISRHAHMPYSPEPDVVVVDIAPPSADLLSARSLLANAVSAQAQLVVVRSQAPTDCAPSDIGTARDARFLDALIVQSEKSLDALRMRNGDLERENKRLATACGELRSENARLRASATEPKVAF